MGRDPDVETCADRFHVLGIEARGEGRQLQQQFLLLAIQQPPTVFEHTEEAGLPATASTAASGEQFETVVQALSQFVEAELTKLGSRQLHGEWQPVELLAYPSHHWHACRADSGSDALGRGGEQSHSGRRRIVGHAERSHVNLALVDQLERFPARCQEPRSGGAFEQLVDHVSDVVGDVFAVVQHEQQIATCDQLDQRIHQISAGELETRRRRKGFHDLFRTRDGDEVDEPHAIDEPIRQLAGYGRRQPGLAGAPDPQQRHQSVLTDQPGNLFDLQVPAHQRRAFHREVVTHGVQAAHNREGSPSVLEQPLGRRKVLEPILTQIEQLIGVDESGRHRRDEDLAAVPG